MFLQEERSMNHSLILLPPEHWLQFKSHSVILKEFITESTFIYIMNDIIPVIIQKKKKNVCCSLLRPFAVSRSRFVTKCKKFYCIFGLENLENDKYSSFFEKKNRTFLFIHDIPSLFDRVLGAMTKSWYFSLPLS